MREQTGLDTGGTVTHSTIQLAVELVTGSLVVTPTRVLPACERLGATH